MKQSNAEELQEILTSQIKRQALDLVKCPAF